jgi:hypothetical protein
MLPIGRATNAIAKTASVASRLAVGDEEGKIA